MIEFAKKTTEGVKGIFTVSPELCKGCGLCIEKCPSQVIDWSDEFGVYGTITIYPKYIDRCTACKICELVCPDAAIDIKKKKVKEEEKIKIFNEKKGEK